MSAGPSIRAKVQRLAADSRARLRVLDLFAGCGGISLGFQAAGCDIVAAVEIDEHAARSHAINFCRGQPNDIVEKHARPRDITKIDPTALMTEFRLGSPAQAVDIIVGGPPCQAYARVGRAKLREVADHPEAFKVDARGNLYLRYLDYVKQLKPLALMLENVPDILNYGGHNVVQEMVDALATMGYEACYSLLNSAHYGVPQMRDRVFMIAIHRLLGASIRFPAATHRCDLPSGYRGTRAVAMKLINQFGGGYICPDAGHSHLLPAVTAAEAIGDLSPITLHRQGKLKRGPRRFTELAAYPSTARVSAYAREIRSWPGFESKEGVWDHVLRYLPRDTPIFEAMQQGDEYPAACRVANRLFEKEAFRRHLARNSGDWKTLHRQMVPPYDPGKFPNRWWKLREDKPSRTLMAHLGKDTYSHIHYDSAQARVITVREAARLQSFPDGFTFAGTMNPAFRQIGNAVPPIMARAVAISLVDSLRQAIARSFAMAAE